MPAKHAGQGLAHTTRGQLEMLFRLWALNQGTVAMSRDILIVTTWGKGGAGLLWVQTRDAAQNPTGQLRTIRAPRAHLSIVPRVG